MIKALSSTVVELPLNGRWVIDVEVLDDDGCAAGGVVPTVTVTPPTGSSTTPTPELLSGGGYRAVVDPIASAGRWTARVAATGYGVADFVAYVTATTAQDGMPTLAEVLDYLGWDEDNANNDAATAFATETSAQRSVCRVGAIYPDDLRGALFRRVARNLALKKLPVAIFASEGDATVLPSNDPEVRRLERPHRRLTVF